MGDQFDELGEGRALTNGALGLGNLQVPRAADVLASAIRDRILSGQMVPGDALPSERELAEDSGLSRGSVRDALRVLELEGLVATRPGRGGGTVVRRPGTDALMHTLEVFIRGRRIRQRSLLEIREIIEPDCAALAAERASDDEIEELATLSESMRDRLDDVASYLTLNAEWHTLLAGYSGNELLAAFMTAIARELREATDLADFNSPAILEAAQRAHELIVKALRKRDPEAARRRMTNHVHAYREAAWNRVNGGDRA